ncbi:hypothetical protein BDW02DRAFT_570005 [Decorospora gaudefroyi]|uniref:Secreted protein n=1 Tax=Decorospora gaudefroyi TaxID=184978 RepID=A0A6A5K6R6_9PLEO|nr:hypothetical protein BDW02DRAFT_570005 [Decorospora gaudefroyi]
MLFAMTTIPMLTLKLLSFTLSIPHDPSPFLTLNLDGLLSALKRRACSSVACVGLHVSPLPRYWVVRVCTRIVVVSLAERIAQYG